MMSDKERERFMPREEVKMRKWGVRQRNLENLIDKTDAFLSTQLSVEDIIYYQHIKALLLMMKERADAHYAKWQMRMKEKNNG